MTLTLVSNKMTAKVGDHLLLKRSCEYALSPGYQSILAEEQRAGSRVLLAMLPRTLWESTAGRAFSGFG